MSPVLSTLLFAAAAAAEVTTSMWLPGPYSAEDVGYVASVIGANGDTVTMVLEYDDETDFSSLGYYEYDNEPETITFHGSTSVENVVTTTDAFDGNELTISMGCEKKGSRGRAVCAYSSNGPAVYSSLCSYYSDYNEIVTSTEVYTFDNPSSEVTQIETYDYRSYIPDYCLGSASTIPESELVQTMTMGSDYFETYQVVVTAGEEKLSATAGATPTDSAASATATGSGASSGASFTAAPSGSGSPTASQSSGAPEQTTNAAPMVTVAPMLAGLGAAVAAFVL